MVGIEMCVGLGDGWCVHVACKGCVSVCVGSGRFSTGGHLCTFMCICICVQVFCIVCIHKVYVSVSFCCFKKHPKPSGLR